MTASTMNETAHIAGASPTPGRFDEVYVALKYPAATDPMSMLGNSLEIARRIEDECQAATLTAAIDMLVDYGIDRDRFLAFLHQVSDYGEARMLARVLDHVQKVTFLARHTEGEA